MLNSREKGWSTFILVVSGIVLLIIGAAVLFFIEFRASLEPNEKEMEKATEQAKLYLQKNYPEMQYKITGVSYNSEEKVENYDYAALILDKETQNSFMVYENKRTGKMEDDLSIQREEEALKRLEPEIERF